MYYNVESINLKSKYETEEVKEESSQEVTE